MISSAFYWSLTLSQFWDVKRKDFWQMFLHHIATIALLCFSWICNLHRIGTLVLLLHDCADIFVEVCVYYSYYYNIVISFIEPAQQLKQVLGSALACNLQRINTFVIFIKPLIALIIKKLQLILL